MTDCRLASGLITQNQPGEQSGRDENTMFQEIPSIIANSRVNCNQFVTSGMLDAALAATISQAFLGPGGLNQDH
jgi:hypothetical protein